MPSAANIAQDLSQSVRDQKRYVLASVIALIISYVVTLEVGYQELGGYWRLYIQNGFEQQRIKTTVQSVHDGTAELNSIRHLYAGENKPDDIPLPSGLQERLKSAQERVVAEKKKISDKLTSQASLGVPGVSLSVPFRILAATWLTAAAILVWLIKRWRTAFYEAVDRLVNARDRARAAAALRALTIPLWTAPLPWQRLSRRNPAWPRELSLGRKPILIALVALASLLLSLRVIWIGIGSIWFYYRISDGAAWAKLDGWGAIWKVVMDASPLIAAIALVVVAVLLLASPFLNGEPKTESSDRQRRLVLMTGVGAMALGMMPATAMARRWFERSESDLRAAFFKSSIRYRPRSKPARRKTGLPAGIYRNAGSGVLYFVGADSVALGLPTAASLANLKPLSQDDIAKKRFRLRSPIANRAIEEFALSGVDRKRVDAAHSAAACRRALIGAQLLVAAERTSGLMRLLDLASGLAARSKDPELLKRVIEVAEGAPKPAEVKKQIELNRRIVKWQAAVGQLQASPSLASAQVSAPHATSLADDDASEPVVSAGAWLRRWSDERFPWKEARLASASARNKVRRRGLEMYVRRFELRA